MRFTYFLALVFALAIGGIHWYQKDSYICAAPVEYRLGAIDPSFSLEREDALSAMKMATNIWDKAGGAAPHFVYDEEADLVVQFVFDERQATANAQEVDQTDLDEARNENNLIRETIAGLQTRYEEMQEDFNSRKSIYDRSLASYNEAVRQVNDRGGAGSTEFDSLNATQLELESESSDLRKLADDLGSVASQLNQLSAEGNRLINSYNQDVNTYNNRYGYEEEFVQGVYTGDEISIFKFSTEAELVSVLAHEFGHALGIDHVEEEGSLMHYLLAEGLESVIPLSDADREALENTCQVDTWQFKVRQMIRSKF